MSFIETDIPKCDKVCMALEIVQRWDSNASGWGEPVEVAHNISSSEVGNSKYLNWHVSDCSNETLKDDSSCKSADKAMKSNVEADNYEQMGKWDKASATILQKPEICKILLENCNIYIIMVSGF